MIEWLNPFFPPMIFTPFLYSDYSDYSDYITNKRNDISNVKLYRDQWPRYDVCYRLIC